MVFVRGLSLSTLNVSANVQSSVDTFKTLLEERSAVSRCHWHLTFAGRPLEDSKQLQHYGVSADSTIQLAFRLLGGKGGFGSLLRGAGRAILTDNVDACRDLSGRRLRQANAEKRLAQWAAEARERELEKIAMKHVKEQEKANKREERAQIDSEAIRREQQEAMDRVTAAVIAAQEILAGGTLESGKRKASLQVTDKPAKRARIFGLDELSDSESDSEDDEELAMFEKAGQLAAAGSSGLDSTVSDQDSAHQLEQTSRKEPQPAAGPSQVGQQSTSQPPHTAPAAAASSQAVKSVQQPVQSAQHASSAAPVNLPAQSLAVDSNGSAVPQPADAMKLATEASDLPASAIDAQAATSQKQSQQSDSCPVMSPSVTAQQTQEPLDIARFDTVQELEGVGMDKLKAELQRHGMKCGGTASERAARLFLLKGSSVKDLDRKHVVKS